MLSRDNFPVQLGLIGFFVFFRKLRSLGFRIWERNNWVAKHRDFGWSGHNPLNGIMAVISNASVTRWPSEPTNMTSPDCRILSR